VLYLLLLLDVVEKNNGLKKNQSDDFLIIFNDFDVLMLKIKKSKKTILIYFQVKNYFKKYHTP
jgi:hypothetical protein